MYDKHERWSKRWLAGAVLLMTLLATLLACKKSPLKLKDAARAVASAANNTKGNSGTTGDAEADKDADVSEKLGHYITCVNNVSGRALQSRRRYLSWVDAKTGPTGKERFIYGLYKVETSSCTTALETAAKLTTPMPEVDAAIGPYKTALQTLIPLINKAEEYYRQKDYKDDKMVQGKAMHGPLLDAFEKFATAADALEHKVSALNDELSARRLARLSKDPTEKLHYHFQKTTMDAKKLVRLAEVSELKELDLAKITAALDTYEKSLDELRTYVDSHKAEADKTIGLSSFVSSSQDYLGAAKALMRRKRDNKDFDHEHALQPEYIEGHPAQVLDKYNRSIDASNRVRFRS